MGKRIKMIVDGEVFPSKKALTERCRKILYRHPINTDLDESETQFLTSLIERYHPEGELKVGCGIKRMWTGHDGYGGVCFFLERLDRTSTDWSFTQCINKPSKKHDFQAACRNAIMDQTIAYKKQRFREGPVCCELTGEQLTLETAHVDHKPPRTFEALLAVFLKRTGIDFNTVEIEPTYDNKMGCWLADAEFAERWKKFHQINARLRLTNRTGNLSVSKREANTMKEQCYT